MHDAVNFYSQADWDESLWLEVVGIEYDQLAARYPFDRITSDLGGNDRPVRLLDVGCGTAIFPRRLDPELAKGVVLECDLLDVSQASLQEAVDNLAQLTHFKTRNTYLSKIEDIPGLFPPGHEPYDLIWAIHSFTTVDVSVMGEVYTRLLDLLSTGGRLLVYQLSSQSAYQVIHSAYREVHPGGPDIQPFMTGEDSERILASLGVPYHVTPLYADHIVPGDRPDILTKYLRKMVLDDQINTRAFFSEMLENFWERDQAVYRFGQQVNLIEIYGEDVRV